jgi:hypothetical protein
MSPVKYHLLVHARPEESRNISSPSANLIVNKKMKQIGRMERSVTEAFSVIAWDVGLMMIVIVWEAFVISLTRKDIK